ncbi:MAG: DHH family phosphoesterase [Candidatus Micrarchaeia archaeon]
MSIYSITHREDLDGLGSAALLVHYYNMDTRNILFIDYSKDVFESTIQKLGKIKTKGSVFIFTDFSLNESFIKPLSNALKKISKNNTCIWLDHHQWSNEAIKTMASYCKLMIVGENTENCATELVYKILCKNSRVGDRLAELAHASDFALDTKDDNLLRDIAFSIKYANRFSKNPEADLRKLVKIIAKGDFNNPIFKELSEKYDKESKKLMKSLIESSIVIKNKKASIALGFSKRLQSTDACITLMKKHNTSIGMFCDVEDGSVHLRSKKNVDCSVIAKAMDGGGHPQACGFEVEIKDFGGFNKAGREKFAELMQELLDKNF